MLERPNAQAQTSGAYPNRENRRALALGRRTCPVPFRATHASQGAISVSKAG
jgi:hypothetical protein